MTHPFLADPENARAYQTLCDHPRGSTRVWAKQAGWTHSKLVRFLDALKRAGIAEVVKPEFGRGSLFRNVPKRSETFRPADLGSKSESDKVPRYAEAPAERQRPIADPDDERLIAAANEVLEGHHRWPAILLNNSGSIVATRKILKVVPVDRAIPLLQQAVRFFNPSATGGESLRSLGHPFITRYVINEWRRIERDREQLPLMPDMKLERSA
jgi:hypothetical protein